MTEENKEDLGEFNGLAARLRGADLSADSLVREPLKERLLARAGRGERRLPLFAWLLPAAAAAALFFVLGPRKAMETPAYTSSYSLPDDGYAQCGRRGLDDYQAGERF